MVADAVINSHKGKAFWLSTDVTGISESHAHRVKKKIVLVVDVIRTLTIFVMAFATIFERPIWCYDDESYDITRKYNKCTGTMMRNISLATTSWWYWMCVVLRQSWLPWVWECMSLLGWMITRSTVWITWTTSRIMEFSTKSKVIAMEQDAALTSALCRMILVMLVSRPIRCGLYAHSYIREPSLTHTSNNTHRKMTLAVIPVTLDVFVLYTVFLIFTSGSVTVLLNPNVVETENIKSNWATLIRRFVLTSWNFYLESNFSGIHVPGSGIHPCCPLCSCIVRWCSSFRQNRVCIQ